MKVKKGTLLQVNHSRSGKWKAKAYKDFDTEKDEWYPLVLVEGEVAQDLTQVWINGQKPPARKGLCRVKVIS